MLRFDRYLIASLAKPKYSQRHPLPDIVIETRVLADTHEVRH